MASKKKTVAAATSRQPEAPPVEYASAIDKLRDEMAKNKDNYVQVVGEYLTAHLLAHPEAEAALLEKDKSIKGSLETVRKEAEKVKTGNMAILDDRTVFGIVLGYFGIKKEPDVLKTGENVLKTGENLPATITDAPGGTAGTSSGPASGATFPIGEDFKSGAQPEPDPFDLDALMGVM